MSSITTSGTLPAPVQQYFDRVLLARPMPLLIHKKMALKKNLPSRSGTTVRYRRYNNLDWALVPLGQSGLTPPAQQLSAVDIDARVDWYGSYVIITDQVTLQNEDPVLNESASLLAQSMRETEDQLTMNVLESTASFVNCTGGVDGDSPTELTRSDIDGIVQTLISNNALMISDNIEGSLKFGTAPVREAYWAMMSSAILDDLEAVNGFISQAQYPAAMNILSAEWGSVGNVRFLYSSIGSSVANASANGATVYNVFITGREALKLGLVKFLVIDMEAQVGDMAQADESLAA